MVDLSLTKCGTLVAELRGLFGGVYGDINTAGLVMDSAGVWHAHQ